LTLRIAQDVEA